MTVLGIESSCDETSASICQEGKIINNLIATQSIHEEYGGVVPELASRAHQRKIVPIVQQAIKQAGIGTSDINAIAVTQGPGLLGSLLVGYSFAKGLAYSLGVPLLNVNHMQAHILAHFIDDPKPQFPFLCMTVSGGHTQIVKVESYTQMQVIGQTRDDAVGEAFDKGAKLLGLPYPGGPLIDKNAIEGDAGRFKFAKSTIPGLDFSFSGIKTSLLYFLREELKKNPRFIEENLHDLCASYQATLIEMLTSKLVEASKQTTISQIAIAGGVAANSYLRLALSDLTNTNNWQLHIPEFQFCTDNAGMVAMAGYLQMKGSKYAAISDSPLPRMTF